jgi:three-Cys-motif partner protein
MGDPYSGREQTKAKHVILRRYLEELAYKILTFSDLTYVDGFSGPWNSRTADFSDTSFKIALDVLSEARRRVDQRIRKAHRLRFFFTESDIAAYAQLSKAVAPFDRPDHQIEVKTHCGTFESAIEAIKSYVATSFPLVFIDPTGWKGMSLQRISPVLTLPKCEVIVNFMFDHVNRWANSHEPAIIASFDEILGGPGWQNRLDPKLPRGLAVEKLFRDTLKSSGSFSHVVSTRIDKTTADRPHFYIAYGTKSLHGLKAFREVEYQALKEHAANRANARQRQREDKFRSADLFADDEVSRQASIVDEVVSKHLAQAERDLSALIEKCDRVAFDAAVAQLLEAYQLRETNVKDICVNLARKGLIENTWGSGRRKPKSGDVLSRVRGSP